MPENRVEKTEKKKTDVEGKDQDKREGEEMGQKKQESTWKHEKWMKRG